MRSITTSANLFRRRFAALPPALLLAGCEGDGGSAPPSPVQTPAARDWVTAHAQAFAGTDPTLADDSDLRAFGDAVGDARIVALAEPDHG